MKILLVSHGFPPERTGGTETYTAYLAEALSREHQVGVFFRTASPVPPEAGGLLRERRNLRLRGYRFVFPMLRPYVLSYRNPGAETVFEGFVRQFRPDLVHFTYLLGGLSVGMVAIARASGARIACTLTDYALLCPRGQLLDDDLALCDGIVPAARCVGCFYGPAPFDNAPGLRVGLRRMAGSFAPLGRASPFLNTRKIEERRRAVGQALAQVDRFFAPARILGERYATHGIPREKIAALCYGVDEALFDGFTPTVSSRLRFGFIGQHLPHKGLHLLIEAAEGLESRDFEVRIYGGEDRSTGKGRAYYRDVLARVRSDRVRFMDRYPPHRVGLAYQDLDVLVVPSLWTENAPLVILNALHTRTPVIATDLGGMSEFVEDGRTGFLFPRGDVAALRERMRRFLEDRSLVASLAANIRPVGSMEEHVAKLLRHYEELKNRELRNGSRDPGNLGSSRAS